MRDYYPRRYFRNVTALLQRKQMERQDPDPLRGDVSSKQSVNALFDSGKFGNKLRSWGSLSELLADPYQGSVMIRYRAPQSPFCVANVPKSEVAERVYQFIRNDGAALEKFSFIEMGDYAGEVWIFQGEVSRSERYYELTYSLYPAPVREAMRRDTRYAHGIEAYGLLRKYVNSSDWDWLQELFDHYPDAVIEFSVWNRCVGEGRRKMIVWEVRTF